MISNFKSLKWISVYSGLGLRHPPLPSFFQMNPCQKTTCRKHFLDLISTNFNPSKLEVWFWQFSASSSMCAGLIFTAVWGHGTFQPGNDTYLPLFFLMVYQLRWWDFPLIIKGLASHKAIRIWRSWDLLSYLHLNNKADGNKPSSETNIMENWPNPSRLALYQLIHTWNNCSETSNLNPLGFFSIHHPTTFTVGNMAFFNIHPNQLPHPPHFVKQGTHQDPCGHSNDTQGQCQG